MAPITYRQWGADLDANALQQMENACQLPVSVAAALMPDAHVGYGLPIGGVLATDNAVIPYAVGVDIACRVKLTVLDLPLGLPAPPRNGSHPRHRSRDALRHRLGIQTSPHPSGDGRRLVGQPRHATFPRQGRRATRHQRQRQSFRRVRRIHASRTSNSAWNRARISPC